MHKSHFQDACGPLPKAGATMVAHNNQLIIYGGQSRIIQGIQQEVVDTIF